MRGIIGLWNEPESLKIYKWVQNEFRMAKVRCTGHLKWKIGKKCLEEYYRKDKMEEGQRAHQEKDSWSD